VTWHLIENKNPVGKAADWANAALAAFFERPQADRSNRRCVGKVAPGTENVK
jgi:hypothetical protein